MSAHTTKTHGELLPWTTDGMCLIRAEDNACYVTDPLWLMLTNSPHAESTTQNVAATCSQEFLGFCFVRPSAGPETSIFGFAEFVTALALLVVVYTVSDVRYRFRVAVAPIPLFQLTFAFAIIIGVGTLLGDIWFAERWPMPNFLSSQPLWQGIFGVLFLTIVLIWMYYSFINPPIFGKHNYKQFAYELFRRILKGSDSELPVIAGELARSATSIVKVSREIPRRWHDEGDAEDHPDTRKPGAADFADDVLLLIGNRKLCRHIIASSPVTAMAFFDAMTANHKYKIPIGQFAKNISTEALINKDSILYHEDEGYSSGLIGYLRPFTKAIYGNYQLVEALGSNDGSPLDINYQMVSSWDATQLEAYSRVVIITLEDYLKSGRWHQHSYVLYRALENIKYSCGDVYKLNDISSDYFSTDIYKRLNTAVGFVEDAINLIDQQQNLPRTKLRIRADDTYKRKDFYDHIANLMFEIIFAASGVTAPQDRCWSVQYNAVWGNFFGLPTNGKAWKIIQFKLCRLIYDEIRNLEKFPNYKSSRILGFCLNVMGLELGKKEGYGSEYYALKKAVLSWTEKNFLRLRSVQPEVATSCLMGSISFDEQEARLVKTYIKGLNLEAPKEYLQLRDAPARRDEPATSASG